MELASGGISLSSSGCWVCLWSVPSAAQSVFGVLCASTMATPGLQGESSLLGTQVLGKLWDREGLGVKETHPNACPSGLVTSSEPGEREREGGEGS